MHEKLTQNKAYQRRLVKRRSSTVEPVLGTLINFFNMKRINSRGMAQANKHVLMSSLSYNLKKYMRFIFKIPSVLAQVLFLHQEENLFFYKSIQRNTKYFILSHAKF
ncbi:MAG: transposase [Myroides sp.]|nr:transposase [Myroides sp.]